MKNLLFTLLLIVSNISIYAQDTIVFKNGDKIKSKVLEVTTTEIKYKKFENIDGPTYSILKSDVSMINYQNGVKDIFNQTSNNSSSVTENTIEPESANENYDIINTKDGQHIKAKIIKIRNDSIEYLDVDKQNENYIISNNDVKSFSYNGWNKFNNIKNERNIRSNKSVTLAKYQDRIGINFGGGSGNQNIPILTLTNGAVASISFGGGASENIEYGHKFNKYFDLAIDIGDEVSTFDQSVSNASMEFERSYFSITPSFVLPLSRSGKVCFKIGAGLDYLFDADLNFDFSNLPGGFRDDWKYTGGIGEHLNFNLTLNSRRRFSYELGVKVYNASYTFKSGSISKPVSSEVINPNGSGVDVIFGIYYNFNWVKN